MRRKLWYWDADSSPAVAVLLSAPPLAHVALTAAGGNVNAEPLLRVALPLPGEPVSKVYDKSIADRGVAVAGSVVDTGVSGGGVAADNVVGNFQSSFPMPRPESKNSRATNMRRREERNEKHLG